MLFKLSSEIKQYLIITGNYWAFTLTDGALRMLVVLHFHSIGYTSLEIAFLFLFYEFFGVVTNLVGGWLGARLGLNRIMNAGLLLQIIALSMLLMPTELLTVTWVMMAQALSGIAKDLNKMSAKSAIKHLVPKDAETTLFKWVAILTGSKNTLKGVGFFLGGLLLTLLGFKAAILSMALGLLIVWLFSLFSLSKASLGKTSNKPKFNEVFSKSQAVNTLSAARLFLFGARDVWFVVALPVYLSTQLAWSTWSVGGFLAVWIIAYGFVQAATPMVLKSHQQTIDGKTVVCWAAILAVIPASIAIGLHNNFSPTFSLLIGLGFFGLVFAINSALHSYLIVSYADQQNVSMNVGFYYTANAMGRLIGTLLSGWIFLSYGLIACLWVSSAFTVIAALISIWLPRKN